MVANIVIAFVFGAGSCLALLAIAGWCGRARLTDGDLLRFLEGYVAQGGGYRFEKEIDVLKRVIKMRDKMICACGSVLALEIHGHCQCAGCGRVLESCCEGAPE